MKPLHHHSSCAERQRGAAMIEFVVAAMFLLVPMVLAVQALGKFANVQHTANSAARYAAWEKTVWFEDTTSEFHDHNRPNQKSAAEIRNEIMVRVLNDRRTGMAYAATDRQATTLARGIDPLWQDAAGTDYVSDPARLTGAGTWRVPQNDVLGAVAQFITSLPLPTGVTGTIVPPGPGNTLGATTVTLSQVGADSGSYQRLWSRAQGLPTDWVGLDFDGRSAILSNAWGANASSGTVGMVGESVPTSQPLGVALVGATVGAIALWDPGPAAFIDMGRIAPDVVPEDRLR